MLAIPFGPSGRFQIRREVIDPRYGLRVALNYLSGLDKIINAIPISSVELPESQCERVNGEVREIDEATYNARACKRDDYLLLDRKTVVVPGRTSPIEVCDILTCKKKLRKHPPQVQRPVPYGRHRRR